MRTKNLGLAEMFWVMASSRGAFIAIGFILALLLTGCGTSEEQKDLLNYINDEMPKIAEIETKVVEGWGGVSGANYTDDLTVYNALQNKITADSLELVEKAEAICPKVKELRDIHEIYIHAVNVQHQAFTTIIGAVENQDYNAVTGANEKLAEARANMRDYQSKLEDYCKANKVELELKDISSASSEQQSRTLEASSPADSVSDEEKVSATTYFVDNGEQGSTIILEPDGTCAVLAAYATSTAYYYGQYEATGNGIVLHLEKDGGIVDIPLSYKESSLVYTGEKVIFPAYPGALYERSGEIPESVKLSPPYMEKNFKVSHTTYYVEGQREDLRPEYTPAIILEPDGTCAFLVNVNVGMDYIYGQYEGTGDGIILHFKHEDGSTLDLPFTMSRNLTYTGDELLGQTGPGAIFYPNDGIPLSVQVMPPYVEANNFARVTAEPSLRMREGPDSDYDIITQIPYGEIVEIVTGWDTEGEWIEVRYNGDFGWVSKEFLSEVN